MGSLRVKIYTNGTSSEICNGLKKPLFELLSNFPHPRNYWNGDEISLAHLIRRRGILFWILYCHHHRPIDLKTNKSSVNPHIYVNISVFPFPFIQIILYLMMIILLYLKSVNQWIFISKENEISSVNPLSDFFLFFAGEFQKVWRMFEYFISHRFYTSYTHQTLPPLKRVWSRRRNSGMILNCRKYEIYYKTN